MEDRVYTEDHIGNTYEVDISDLKKGFKFVVPYSGPGEGKEIEISEEEVYNCLLYTSPSPRDGLLSRMPSSA